MQKKALVAPPVHELVEAPPGLRMPAWRYVVAMDFTADLDKNIKPLLFDPYLEEAARYNREMKLCQVDFKRRYIPEPAIRWAFKIFGMSNPDGMRWVIDALIIGGMPDKEIAKVTGTTPEIICAYRTIFYDITWCLKDTDMVYNCVLPVSRAAVGLTNSCDYGWKRFSLEFGAEDFLKFRRAGGRTPNKEHLEWLQWQQSHKALETANHAQVDANNMYNECAVNIVNTAQRYWKLLQDDVALLSNGSSSFDAFFNKLIPQVQLTMKNATLLSEGETTKVNMLPAREMVPVKLLTAAPEEPAKS